MDSATYLAIFCVAKHGNFRNVFWVTVCALWGWIGLWNIVWCFEIWMDRRSVSHSAMIFIFWGTVCSLGWIWNTVDKVCEYCEGWVNATVWIFVIYLWDTKGDYSLTFFAFCGENQMKNICGKYLWHIQRAVTISYLEIFGGFYGEQNKEFGELFVKSWLATKKENKLY